MLHKYEYNTSRLNGCCLCSWRNEMIDLLFESLCETYQWSNYASFSYCDISESDTSLLTSLKGLYKQGRKNQPTDTEQLKGAANESDRERVRSNHCSVAVITLSPLVAVLLSELECSTRVISPNDLSHLPHLRTSECGWHECGRGEGSRGG